LFLGEGVGMGVSCLIGGLGRLSFSIIGAAFVIGGVAAIVLSTSGWRTRGLV